MTIIDRFSVVMPADNIPGTRQGQWTYKDYAALPDNGQRYEIVNGVLLMAPAPSGSHQKAAGKIFYYLLTYVEFAGWGQVFQAPFDVELLPDMVVQPDVLVLLNTGLDKYVESRIIGAPDLVVEVVSPGTAAYDRLSKYDAYAHAGVPEYWIANPLKRTVEVLVLKNGRYNSLGVFEGSNSLPSKIVPGISVVRVEQFFS